MNMCIVITGCSTVGKTTLANLLLASFKNIELVISTVTRPEREGDINYRFINNEEFEKMIEFNFFLDCGKVFSDSWYGTMRTDFEAVIERGNIPLIVADMRGAKNIYEQIGSNECCVINLIPKNIESTIARIKEKRYDHIEERIASLNWEVQEVDEFRNFKIELVDDCIDRILQVVKEKIISRGIRRGSLRRECWACRAYKLGVKSRKPFRHSCGKK